MQALFIVLSFALLSARLCTPFLHTHNDTEHSGVQVTVSACPACEIESTPVVESSDAIILPSLTIVQEIIVEPLCDALPIACATGEVLLRGPPSIS